MFVNERCEKWAKLFTTLLFISITLSFITLDVFHIYMYSKAYLWYKVRYVHIYHTSYYPSFAVRKR